MSTSRIPSVFLAAVLAGAIACAVAKPAAAPSQEVTVVDSVGGPEGPLVVGGDLYYVAWTGNTLSKWDGKTSTVVNDEPGCGHNGVALTPAKTLLVACSADPGAIMEVDLTGKKLREWKADRAGTPFVGGINDIVVAANGGAYATVFGPFAERPTKIIGKVLYLAPGAMNWVEAARDLNYPNGVGISPDQHTLYVAQTAGNSILQFTIAPDGTLTDRADFAFLARLTHDVSDSWWLGPDSMKLDPNGNLYVAQWSAGRILKLSPQGELLHVFDVAAGRGTTNVAFSEDGRDLYVSVVRDPDDPKAMGRIVKIPNVE
jgi:gluconolactonase